MFNSYFTKALTGPMAVAVFTYVLMSGNVIAAENEMQAVAFPDKYMFRLGTYIVDGSDTQFSVNTPSGLGTVIDYNRDLGETVEIPFPGSMPITASMNDTVLTSLPLLSIEKAPEH